MDILAAFAHPDDETRFFGGTLPMLASKGARVHILIATRGEGGEVGEPPLCTQKQLGEIREKEMQCAADALGASSLTFLDYTDPAVSDEGKVFAFDAELDTLASQILAAAQKIGAQVIISHGSNGEYGHPAHKLMHQAVKRIRKMDQSMVLYSVSAIYDNHPKPRLANQDDHADFVLNIQPWYSSKLDATICHQTQHALFVRRASKAAGRQMSLAEVTCDEESLHRMWPTEKSDLDDPLANFLRTSCVEALRET
jgi:LmbE family N-acetylglucosaminyl deacetylase